MQFPAKFHLVDRSVRVTAATATNLKLLADVMRHVGGSIAYEGGYKWLQSLNSVVHQLRYDARTMADGMITFEDTLNHDMVMDMMREVRCDDAMP